jgi:hypothetical protein
MNCSTGDEVATKRLLAMGGQFALSPVTWQRAFWNKTCDLRCRAIPNGIGLNESDSEKTGSEANFSEPFPFPRELGLRGVGAFSWEV